MNAVDDDGRAGADQPGDEPVEFRRAIGGAVRHLRTAAGRTQDDVARAARTVGLPWDRSKVAALERGEKTITAEELILLPLALQRAEVEIFDMVELFGPPNSLVALSRTAQPRTPAEIAWMLRGLPKASPLDPEDFGVFGMFIPPPGTRVILPDPGEEDAAIKRVTKLGFKDVSYHAFQRAAAQAGEAEEKAARKLGETKLVIAGIAAALWGRSLTQERDERVANSIAGDLDELTPRQIQATRGHHTRKLLAEMEIRLSDAARRRAEDRLTDLHARVYAAQHALDEAKTAGAPAEKLAVLRGGLAAVSSDLTTAIAELDDAHLRAHSARLDPDKVIDAAVDRMIESGINVERGDGRRRKRS